jgi:NAD(P)-dependent dehydrogenase (short-subunit alcohol dehydrogenase family)
VGGKVVVVTGATAGLGRAIARRFAPEASGIALIARGEEGLEATAREMTSLGAKAIALSVDVADWAAVRRAAKQIEDDLGPIAIWINNAMTSVFAPFVELEMADFERATRVNYLGYVHGTKAALEHMVPRGRGVIIQVSSALAFRSIPLQSAYCGSKHAIMGFTESLRTELLHDKNDIRVTMVHMPAMNTPQFGWVRSLLPHRAQPVPPIYQPEICAEVVRFAADHPGRKGYFVGASTVLTVLGNRIASGVLDRYLARTGYKAQQTDEPENPERPDNLYRPVPGVHGAHGTFDSRSHARSLQAWITMRRGIVISSLSGVGSALGVLGYRSRHQSRTGARQPRR